MCETNCSEISLELILTRVHLSPNINFTEPVQLYKTKKYTLGADVLVFAGS